MVGLNAKFYQVKANGVAYPVADSLKTPFATVIFFKAKQSIAIKGAMNYEQIQKP